MALNLTKRNELTRRLTNNETDANWTAIEDFVNALDPGTNPLVNISSGYVQLATDYIINFTGSTAIDVDLLTAVGEAGRTLVIKNSGTAIVTVNANGAETIDGETSQTLDPYDSMTIVSDDTNLIII